MAKKENSVLNFFKDSKNTMLLAGAMALSSIGFAQTHSPRAPVPTRGSYPQPQTGVKTPVQSQSNGQTKNQGVQEQKIGPFISENNRDIWMFNVGASMDPLSRGKPHFNWHGLTPGIGPEGSFVRTHTWLTGGYTVTGKKIGGAGSYSTPWRHGAYSWKQQFTRGEIGVMAGQKLQSGGVGMIAGVEVTGSLFPGQETLIANYMDVGVNPKVIFFAGLLGEEDEIKLGVYASASYNAVTFTNPNNYVGRAIQKYAIGEDNFPELFNLKVGATLTLGGKKKQPAPK